MRVETLASPLELWAGVECTVNRVGCQYFDQLERSAHARRASDLLLFKNLDARAVRYPILWERTAPLGLENADWSWADERLCGLRALGLRPIVGLLHHGSGPRDTSLVNEEFPDKLARFARAVAERYPWVEDYTPVNEPLTTARFSGLYGHWYPHERSDRAFARAFLNQCRAIALSMRAVRQINPQARLIQTEDLGKTFSTPQLRYQAEFENERRWLTWDLLMGRVTRGHAVWDYLRWAGVTEDELGWFADNPCPPDIIGVNHYITSERFLDERLSRYPKSSQGGNGRHRYADVEAVRVCAEGVAGPKVLLRETWERYRAPLAITEAHLGCTREEQLRWVKEVWDGAESLRREGVDVRAVTAWSVLGSYNWHNLLTRDEGHYEPGVYDLRTAGGSPRPTALARMLSELAKGRTFDHPALASPGWWRRLSRFCYPPVAHRPHIVPAASQGVNVKGEKTRPLLITGATGTLGRAFARICETRGLAYRLLDRREMEITEAESVSQTLDEYRPWAVINAAGYVRVDDAEQEQERCHRENTLGPMVLAAACRERGTALLTFSSDLVFDGRKREPYVESDTVAPLNVYGRTKAEAEARVVELLPQALVIRTSAFFGPWDEYNFVTALLRTLSANQTFAAADDVMISPTYVPDLVHASLDLLIDGESGVWHLSSGGKGLTWAEFAKQAARGAGLNEALVEARPNESFALPAPRPAYTILGSERAELLPPLDQALARYLSDCDVWKTRLGKSAVL